MHSNEVLACDRHRSHDSKWCVGFGHLCSRRDVKVAGCGEFDEGNSSGVGGFGETWNVNEFHFPFVFGAGCGYLVVRALPRSEVFIFFYVVLNL
jgi:hypothetical protein